MTSILLIRHGQASFGAADYDRLSETGIRQACLLGEQLSREGRPLAAAFSGTLRRQVDTALHTLQRLDVPKAHVASDHFDEYPLVDLFNAYLPVVAASNARIAAACADLHADRRLYMEALAAVVGLWQSGHEAPGVETWAGFRRRVIGGLEGRLAGRGKADLLAIFTSGGVIGTAVSEILGLPPEYAFSLNWRIFNASITEIHYGRSGFALATFNSVAHLRAKGDNELVTYW
ncbi:histidine phosphatase family protein [Rhodoblastus sp.]|uniref:histidine phosphatase family protein n=1 Tax=Rhodoblastus sp. TaxID=1962975 RepID=UPI003F9EA38E